MGFSLYLESDGQRRVIYNQSRRYVLYIGPWGGEISFLSSGIISQDDFNKEFNGFREEKIIDEDTRLVDALIVRAKDLITKKTEIGELMKKWEKEVYTPNGGENKIKELEEIWRAEFKVLQFKHNNLRNDILSLLG